MKDCFDAQQAVEHTRHLSSTIGSRVMGSTGDREAADFIRLHFERLGLRSWEQSFGVECATRIADSFEVIEPSAGAIPCWPILLTPDTPEEGITGELVVVEGSQEPQVGPHLTGKIALWSTTGRMDYLAGYRKLAKYSPKAIVVIWPALGVSAKHLLVGESMASPYARVPSFCISYEEGLKLLRMGARRARLVLRTNHFSSASQDVIGEIRGTDHPEEIIVVGGHYDAMPEVPGAIDNASGVAMVMELARLFAHRRPRRTLRFVAWGGEEGGMLGSLAYTQQLKAAGIPTSQGCCGGDKDVSGDGARHVLCVSLDGLGVSLGQTVCYVEAAPEVSAEMRRLAQEFSLPMSVSEEYYGSDGEMFVRCGIPSVSFGRVGPSLGYLHSPEDSIELINPEQLRLVGALVDTFLCHVAVDAESWPYPHGVPAGLAEEVAAILRRIGWLPEETD